MGAVLSGGDETAKNNASETASLSASISNDISLDSSMTCGNFNEIDIQNDCSIIDSIIKQHGTCSMTNKSSQNSTISNAIKQTSKQSLAQTAKAVGQNFSLNFGNVNASNIGSQSVKTQGNISNKISSSCSSAALNKNLVNCEGGNLIHSQIDQSTAANINQECIQKTGLTNKLTQSVEQAITQKATAIKENAITAILLAVAALILSIGVATKLGVGKVIRYILMFFCALMIIIFIAMFAWNMIASPNVLTAKGIQKENTEGDYCPDVSIFTHNQQRHDSISPSANAHYYRDALHCVAAGGQWANYDGKVTKGYSTQRWPGPGPAPPEGTNGWNPLLDPKGDSGGIHEKIPQCYVLGADEAQADNQCWAINTGIEHDLFWSSYDTVKPNLPLPMFVSSGPTNKLTKSLPFPSGTEWDGGDYWNRNYTFWKDKCLANKCMWTPEQFSMENPEKNALRSSILTTDGGDSVIALSKILDSLPAYSYGISIGGNFNTPAHKQQASIQQPWFDSIGEAIDGMAPSTIKSHILPVALRYIPTIGVDDIKAMYSHTDRKEQYVKMSEISSGAHAYTLFPFCTGGRSLFEDNTETVGKIASCSKTIVDRQKKNKK